MSKRRGPLFLVALASLLMLGATPLHANFDDVVRAVESRYHIHRTTIPFFGLVRFALWVASPAGVSDLQLATFENAAFDNAGDLAEIVRRNAGEPMQPLVQTRSNRSGETTLIYAHPLNADRVALLIFTHDRDDTTLLRVVVSPEKFQTAMKRPDGVVASLK
jgi:hypothetical protein